MVPNQSKNKRSKKFLLYSSFLLAGIMSFKFESERKERGLGVNLRLFLSKSEKLKNLGLSMEKTLGIFNQIFGMEKRKVDEVVKSF